MIPARLISLNQRQGVLHQVLNLRHEETIIGRQEGCKVRIPSAAVSRQHCKVSVLGELLAAEDLGSANGTFINEIRITQQSYLKPGDVLRVGPFRFLVHYQLSDAAVESLLDYLTTAGKVDVDLLDPDSIILEAADEPVAIDPIPQALPFGARPPRR